jgi:hypothetical protein
MGLVERLHAELARGPIAAALAAREEVELDAAAAAAIADDGDLDMSVRVAALLAVALAAQGGMRVPDAALGVLEDDLLLDAVFASGASAAVTGIVAAAGDRISDGVRRYLGLRLSAAGVTGIHVAVLLVGVGDHEGAVRAAVPAFARGVRGDDHDPVLLALASIALDWMQDEGVFMTRLAAALPAEVRDQLLRGVRAQATSDHPLVRLLGGE